MILEVKNRKLAKVFLDLPRKLYKNDPGWVSPLDSDIASIFDPQTNSYFKHGECTRWVLYMNGNEPIGRIAAFINHQKTGKEDLPTGGIGFFECIHDQAAANALFDTAKAWLAGRGMKAMEGPVNFGENDKFWGLLVEGFIAPGYGMNYNPSFYVAMFEKYGFKKAYDQITNVLYVNKPLPERFTKISDRVMSRKEYSFEHFDSGRIEKFIGDFQQVYNDAWQEFENFHPIEAEVIRESFRQMKPLIDEKIIWFAYYNSDPIAFIVCLPDANQILKHLHGKLNLLGKMLFLWYKKTHTIDRIRIVVMGCMRKFQNHGIESALIRCLQKEVLPRNTIREVELAWVGDFNKKMMALHEATGAVKSKVHRTYRYAFDA